MLGFVASLYLVTPLSGRPGQQYLLALVLIVVGVLLFALTMVINRQLGIPTRAVGDPVQMVSPPD